MKKTIVIPAVLVAVLVVGGVVLSRHRGAAVVEHTRMSRVVTGMSPEEVTETLGGPGVKLSDQVDSLGKRTATYEWKMDNDKSKRLIFVDGHLAFISSSQ